MRWIKVVFGFFLIAGSVGWGAAKSWALMEISSDTATSVPLAASTVTDAQGNVIVTSDARIREQIEAALRAQPTISGQPVSVQVSAGDVQLSGKLGTVEQSDLAAQIAHGVPGVVRVDNFITIEAELQPPAAVIVPS